MVFLKNENKSDGSLVTMASGPFFLRYGEPAISEPAVVLVGLWAVSTKQQVGKL